MESLPDQLKNQLFALINSHVKAQISQDPDLTVFALERLQNFLGAVMIIPNAPDAPPEAGGDFELPAGVEVAVIDGSPQSTNGVGSRSKARGATN